ncbi:F-box/kelch-repeat protein At3g06240-like [Mercurialis annua]|uniref:F-box/kelch-repeat protein At3g06240-like n=1 Tax=Mercurialis annua TaxID=3986 RepID=UPI00215E436C|nr:F-box/kelch-repeat protein At3g06240-like [Mercurialis annua]
MSVYLHEEVVVEILKRLPVKSVLKFKCVCRSWYALITNPNFISLHLAHAAESNTTFSLVMKYKQLDSKKPEFVLHSDNDSFSEYRQLDLHSFNECGNDVWIVGSCDGLICLCDTKFKRLIVWNPAIGEFITTSLSTICNGPYHILGIGFDRKNNSYKVMRIVFAWNDTTFLPFAEIFQLSSNSWKTVPIKNLRYDFYGSLIEWNGVFHRFADTHDGRKKMIASFDLSNEVFQEMMLPHALATIDNCYLSLTVYSRSLAAIHYEDRIRNTCNLTCSIWVMKEYGEAESWTKQVTVDFKDHGGLKPVLSFQGNGGILVENRDDELASYDPETQRVTPLGVSGRVLDDYSYVESLVLVKGKRNKNNQG